MGTLHSQAAKWAPRLLLAPLFVFPSFAQTPALPPSVQNSIQTPSTRIPSETQEQALRLQWRTLVDNHAWAELDALAGRLRTERARFQGGSWQLHMLYIILGSIPSETASDAEWQAHLQALEQWSRSAPSSPTPRIALAEAYQKFAWKARGDGFSDSVTVEGERLFAERMHQSLDVLQRARTFARSDPEWYEASLTALLITDHDPSQVEPLFDEATQSEPEYFYNARVLARFLLPKWYGEPGDTERFAAKLADRVGGSQGDALYFYLAEYVLVTEQCECQIFHTRAMPWTRILKGYHVVEQRYGTSNYQRNGIAMLALRVGDTYTAKEAFLQIGDNWNREVWGSKESFDAARRVLTRPRSAPLLIVPSQ